MADKPNIVMVMADDMGYWSMGCAGNREVRTPNLDRLAGEGMYFPDYFCTSPVCSPARASVLCGRMPSQHGVHDWISKGHLNYQEVSPALREKHEDPDASWEYAWSRQQLKGDRAIRYLDGFRAYTEILAEHGYTCGLAGKWHLGDAGHPQKGFTYWEPIAMGGDNYYYPVVLQGGQFDMLRDTYITDYITEKALDFLKGKDKDRPFYLSVHYTAPHSPWERSQHPAEFYNLYQDCPFTETPNVPPHKWGHGYTQEDRRNRLQGYYAAVTAMDSDIGKIIDCLKADGLYHCSGCPGSSFAEIFHGQVPDGGKAIVIYRAWTDSPGGKRRERTGSLYPVMHMRGAHAKKQVTEWTSQYIMDSKYTQR